MIASPNGNQPHVVVIGGGPAGTTVSTLVAQQGYRVELFERETFPRFHIGESLIPQTYFVLERLKMLPKMQGSRFVKKYSVQFVNQRGKLSEPFYFVEHKPHESSQTWQVLRSEFDQMMLDNAREQGVTVHEGAHVTEVLFDGDRARGICVKLDDGTIREVLADVVVDASGQSTMIMDRFNLRVWDPDLKKAALWTYWKGAQRDTGRDEGATIVLQTEGKQGWFWYIPLHDDIISVGVVAGFDYLFKDRPTKDHEAIYFEEVARCPGLQPRIANAERAGPFRVLKEYSYKAKRAAGDGWVLVGDAFGFLDPLYSSGVLLALKSGQLAADAIVDALAAGDTSAARLGGWQPDFVRGMDRMRRLVIAYYEGFSFGLFVKNHPHLKGLLTDLLIGDLFKDEVDAVWEPMEQIWKEMTASAG
ncbi:MAG: NAD(P)/FAD-dependent oxidoreductase [Planctomycetota bacterium]|nr:MAG: NAD(P)/FAD-dependent oxidoreductase [Planctomycetota bacterium]